MTWFRKKHVDGRSYLLRATRVPARILIPHGIVHIPLAYDGVLSPEPIIDEWYYPRVLWSAILGPVAVSGQWYARLVWVDWMNNRISNCKVPKNATGQKDGT